MRFRCVESRRGEDFEASKPKDYRNSPLLVQAPEVSLGFLFPRGRYGSGPLRMHGDATRILLKVHVAACGPGASPKCLPSVSDSHVSVRDGSLHFDEKGVSAIL